MTASYPGDSANAGSSGAATLVVQATPSISTALSSTTAAVGQPVTDSATLTGGASAGGTVTYYFYADGACGSGQTQVGARVTVTGGVVPASAPQTFTSLGSYSWNAAYSGDGNNVGAASACEPLTVQEASPTVTTLVSPSTITLTTTSGSATDAVTVTGGFAPTGTITFQVSKDSCSTTAVAGFPSSSSSDSKTVSGNGVYTSDSFAPPGAGIFYWEVTYSGDANNNAFSLCGGTGESLSVAPASPTIGTTLSSSAITVGNVVTDSAILAGGFHPGGAVAYFYYIDGACTAGETLVGSPVAVSAGVVPDSASQPFTLTGSHSWNAAYSGDPNNGPVTSACEPLAVNPASPSLSTYVDPSSITIGGLAADYATFTGGYGPTGTITYAVYSDRLVLERGRRILERGHLQRQRPTSSIRRVHSLRSGDLLLDGHILGRP